MELDPRSAIDRPKRLNRRDKLHFGDGRPAMGTLHFTAFLSLDYDDTPSAWAWIADRGAVREDAIGLIHREPPSRKHLGRPSNGWGGEIET